MTDKRISHIKYVCTRCGLVTARDKLTVKRVMFQSMGIKFRTLRSKVVDWLCESCREQDEVWNTEKFFGTPGMVGTSKEKQDG